MTPRSRIHMLTVAAARLEQECANPKLIADLREAAKHEAEAYAEGRRHSLDEEKRIERQRTLMQMLPDTRAVDQLKAAMLQRAYDLMWDGNPGACDALAEFLPDCPEPSANRSASYRHGFANGRDDRRGKPRDTYENICRQAEEAMMRRADLA